MSTFTVIGLCESSEQAEKIADTLYGHIEAIAQWHINHRFKSEKLKGKPSPAELELATQYNLTWNQLHDWLIVPELDDISETVSVYDNLVFITSGETKASPQPFDALMKALVSDVLVDADGSPVMVTIEATLNNPQKIADVIQTYITQDAIAPCPWMIYLDGEKDPEADRILALEPVYLQHLRAVTALDSHPSLAGIRNPQAYAKAYMALYNTTIQALPALDVDDAELLDDLRDAGAIIPSWDNRADMPPYPTAILAQNDQISLKNVLFGEIASGLPAFLAWLEAEGASDVSYELSE
ncbi:MAG: hypothetical protein MUE54_01480 [Anaerolineae bacterium]|jgi:hypothetical protein|nr:hypothetical protein [Anaerolineae bacterium]